MANKKTLKRREQRHKSKLLKGPIVIPPKYNVMDDSPYFILFQDLTKPEMQAVLVILRTYVNDNFTYAKIGEDKLEYWNNFYGADHYKKVHDIIDTDIVYDKVLFFKEVGRKALSHGLIVNDVVYKFASLKVCRRDRAEFRRMVRKYLSQAFDYEESVHRIMAGFDFAYVA